MSDIEEFIHFQREGIELCKQNANNLFKSAELLSVNLFYSPAIPILILSAEEVIKCFALCLEIFLGSQSEVKKVIYGSKSKKADSYMFDHQDKHKLSQAIISDLDAISPIISILKLVSRGDFKIAINFLSISAVEKSQIESILTALNHFNSSKNAGFYVDNKGNKWHTPLKFGEKEYKGILESVSTLRQAFLPKIEYFMNYPENELVTLYEIIKK